jgi:hypothetical protein
MLSDEERAAMRSRAARWLMPDVGSFDLKNDVYALLTENAALRERLAAARAIISELLPELPAYDRWTDVRDQARAWLAAAASPDPAPPMLKHPGHDTMCQCAECVAYWAATFAEDPDLDQAEVE